MPDWIVKGGEPLKTVKKHCVTCGKETDVLNYTCMECLFDVRTEFKDRYIIIR